MSKIVEIRAGQTLRRVVPRVRFPGAVGRDLVVEVHGTGVVLRGKHTGKSISLEWSTMAKCGRIPVDAPIWATERPLEWLLEKGDEA